MKNIDKAWEINLKEDDYHKYDSKEAIISDMCPSDYVLKDGSCCGTGIGNNCTRCWNEEIIEDEVISRETKPIIEDDKDTVTSSDLPQYKITNEDRFNSLRQSPINGICLNNMDVEQLKYYLKTNHKDGIVYIQQLEETCLQYDDIPKLIEWLKEVYNLATELKIEIDEEDKYTNFYLAREHMEKGGKCQYEGKTYYIKNRIMKYKINGVDISNTAYLKLTDIDSEKWLILDK